VRQEDFDKMIAYCHKCSEELDLFTKIARTDTCDHCKADLHCCKNCEFYEPGANNDCREPMMHEPDKEKANFCASFGMTKKKPATQTSRNDVKAKFDALFKKK
jgi:hypothetical protein